MHWEMKQRETLTNEEARESIACKPQPENEFHKVVPGLSPSSRIFTTEAADNAWCKVGGKSMQNSNATYRP